MLEFNAYGILKPIISEEEFLRGAVIKVASNKKSPANIGDLKILEDDNKSRCRKKIKNILLIESSVGVSYSASVGYDRKEEYVVTSTDHEGNTVFETKTRTVTDWRPFSGNEHVDIDIAVYNEDNCRTGSLLNMLNSVCDVGEQCETADDVALAFDSKWEEAPGTSFGNVKVNPQAYDYAKAEAIKMAEDSLSFPGDHVQRIHKSSTITIKNLTCFQLPYYTAEYEFNDIRYSLSGYACGDINNIGGDTPPKGSNLRGSATKKSLWALIMAILLCSAAVGCLITSFLGTAYMELAVSNTILLICTGVLAVAGIIFYIVFSKTRNMILKKYVQQDALARIDSINELLKREGWEELTSSEESYFI